VSIWTTIVKHGSFKQFLTSHYLSSGLSLSSTFLTSDVNPTRHTPTSRPHPHGPNPLALTAHLPEHHFHSRQPTQTPCATAKHQPQLHHASFAISHAKGLVSSPAAAVPVFWIPARYRMLVSFRDLAIEY
jgi:hypothetical protein